MAKEWILISPKDEKFYLNGNLEQFCIENKISLGVLRNSLNKKIELKNFRYIYSRYKNKALNTVDWTLYLKEFYDINFKNKK